MNMKQRFIVIITVWARSYVVSFIFLTNLGDKDVTLRYETVWKLHNNLGMVYHTDFFPL